MPSALVTGGAGFLGSRLCEALIASDMEVWALDDLSTGRVENVAKLRQNERFHLVNESVLARNVVNELVLRCDVVFHLAACVGVRLIVEEPVKTLLTNVRGTELVLEHCQRFGKPVFLASTSEVYGAHEPGEELREDAIRIYGPVQQRRWAYAASKAHDEFLALAYAQEEGLRVVVGRLFNVCGPRQSGRYGMVVPRFVQRALIGKPIEVYGDGTQRRCFLHVDDAVTAMILLMAAEEWGEVFNVGSRESVSILELAGLVKEVTESDSEIVFTPFEQVYGRGIEDMPDRRPAITKIHAATGWRPTIELRQVIADTVQHAGEAMLVTSD